MSAPTITHLDVSRHRARGATETPPQRRVADVMCTDLARVPSWFTVAQARRVAELKGVGHVLIEDKRGVSGSASAVTLRAAPATDLVARWTCRSSASIDVSATTIAAEDLLLAEGSACLPVTSGGMLVGTISFGDLVLSDDSTPWAA